MRHRGKNTSDDFSTTINGKNGKGAHKKGFCAWLMSMSVLLVAVSLAAIVFLFICNSSLREEVELLSLKSQNCETSLISLNSSNQMTENQLSSVQNSNMKCTESLQSLQSKVHDLKLASSNSDHQFSGIKSISKDLVELEFGREPYFVELNLKLPDKAEDNLVVFKLAPLELMPYTVWFFLNQVNKGWWDNCCFIRNAPHVLQAHPSSVDDRSLMNRFEKPLRSVNFQEYSPQYTHEKFRIGLAGRPGGPDFYINLQNNTISHGPGGQTQYKVREEADACFAELVQGVSVIEEMKKLPVGDSGYRKLIKFVEISKARILPREETQNWDTSRNKQSV